MQKRLYVVSVVLVRPRGNNLFDISNHVRYELTDDNVDALKMRAIREAMASYPGYTLSGEPCAVEIPPDTARALLLQNRPNFVVHEGGKDEPA